MYSRNNIDLQNVQIKKMQQDYEINNQRESEHLIIKSNTGEADNGKFIMDEIMHK